MDEDKNDEEANNFEEIDDNIIIEKISILIMV